MSGVLDRGQTRHAGRSQYLALQAGCYEPLDSTHLDTQGAAPPAGSVTIFYMGGALKVTVAGLRALAQSSTDQAAQFVASPSSPVAAASWQSSGTGANTVNARDGKVTTTMNARLTANAAKFSLAADNYEKQDEQGAAAVSAAAPPAASAGGDGGAGRLPTPPPVPSTVLEGDGGAAAFPTPR